MHAHNFLDFFNNSTIAGLITVIAGLFVGSYIYKRQKKIDRQYDAEDKLVENLLLLEEHCKAVNQTIDRLAGTYIRIFNDKDVKAAQKFRNGSLVSEIEDASKVLMYRIPEDTSKIESIVSLYFSGEKEIENDIQAIFTEMKNWHDFVQNYATGKTDLKFDLTKRVSEVPQLSLKNLNEKIKALISRLR